MLSAKAVKDLYLGAEQEVYSMSRLFSYHNEISTTDLKWSTLKHYYVTQRYLVKFLEQQYNASDIYLHQLDKYAWQYAVHRANARCGGSKIPSNTQKPQRHQRDRS